MIKAIIFDCFGVLATDGWLPLKKKYFANDIKLFKEAGRLNGQVDAGLITQQDRVSWVAKTTGLSEKEVWHQLSLNLPNKDLLAYIVKLKSNYKIGMLSNVGGDYLKEIFTKKDIALFDAVSLSYETGIAKPDPRAYGAITEKLGIEPEECVFIDDQVRYCYAAQSIGMQAIQYQNLEQSKNDLEKILQK
jgi:epoxide hydrolase-like predicted phosphatase